MSELDDPDLADRLRAAGIALTLQRLVIARVLLSRPIHLAADQVWERAQVIMPAISRATVYNTLDLFVRFDLLRRLIIAPEKVVYDSDTAPHHHLYDASTGELTDISAGEVEVIGMPTLPPGMEVAGVDVVVRIRQRSA
jgi:Fur family iron response transcriptional regulator